MLLLGETATLGAFLAQDLLLFVLFFDLMIVPFYFLFGIWGSDREGGQTASAATLKMIVFTLIGSLLMLVAAIATAIIAADGGELTFNMTELRAGPAGDGSQNWIFWFFAVAFLVKMPAFPLHGWMPDAYRAAPLPALAVFSGVLSKVGAYGFLRVVLPLMPDATVAVPGGDADDRPRLDPLRLGDGLHQDRPAADPRLLLDRPARLHHRRHLRPERRGGEGALLQMVNHGLVVVPLFLIVALIGERFGSEDISGMGGLAKKAPVFAVIFLIVTMATLAIPGSANFIGEFFIVNGALPDEDRDRDHRHQRHGVLGLLRAAPVPADDAQPLARRRRVA